MSDEDRLIIVKYDAKTETWVVDEDSRHHLESNMPKGSIGYPTLVLHVRDIESTIKEAPTPGLFY